MNGSAARNRQSRDYGIRRTAGWVLWTTVLVMVASSLAWQPPGPAVAQEGGTARTAPASQGTEVISGDLAITVVEVVSGEDALDRLQDVNPFNTELPNDEEHVLVLVRVRHAGSENQLEVDVSNFGLTASGNVLYPPVAAVPPDPQLGVTLFPGDQAHGWVPLRVGSDESHRQLVYAPDLQGQYDRWRFLALDEDGPIPPADGSTVPEPNETGNDQEQPAMLGEPVVTPYFAVEVVEVVRGDEATDLLMESDPFHAPPSDGLDDMLVNVRVTSRIAEDFPLLVSSLDYSIVGDGDVAVLPSFSIVPHPQLYALVYPAGTVEGWMSFQIQQNLNTPILEYLWHLDPDTDERYIAID